MPPHGFASTSQFRLVEQSVDGCTLELTESDATLAVYPFRFSLRLAYRLEGTAVAVAAHMTNTGDARMPASFGFHPGFRWPLPGSSEKAGHVLVFSDDDWLDCRTLADGFLLPQTRRLSLDENQLPLSEELFSTSAQVILDYRSQTVSFHGPGRGPEVAVTAKNLPQLGLWMRPGGDFLCIEPWHGHSAPADLCGELDQRPGGFTLAPGASEMFSMRIAVHDQATGA
jgi:galactose mutarotase-like enzyme